MALITKDCLCCHDGNCCSVTSGLDLDYTPPAGYNLNEITVINLDPNNCVGEARAYIDIWSWANPEIQCNGLCTSDTQPCGPIPTSVKNAFLSELVSRASTHGDGSYRYTPGTGVNMGKESQGPYPPPELNGCGFSLWTESLNPYGYNRESCVHPESGNPVVVVTERIFTSDEVITESPPCGWAGAGQPYNWLLENRVKPFLRPINADFLSTPFKIKAYSGSTFCEYWLYGVDVDSPQTPVIDTCYNRHYNNGWYIDKIWGHSFGSFHMLCGTRCGAEPCTVTNFPWPTTIDCVCSDHYKKPVISGSTSCKLYLDSTRPTEYRDSKCFYRATYCGVIEAGIVDCVATPNDPDCKCCG